MRFGTIIGLCTFDDLPAALDAKVAYAAAFGQARWRHGRRPTLAEVYGVLDTTGARSGRRQWRSAWAAAAAGFLALGLAAYAAGRSGSPLCRPDSLWQYHGAWHVLSAAAAGCAARVMAPGVNQRE